METANPMLDRRVRTCRDWRGIRLCLLAAQYQQSHGADGSTGFVFEIQPACSPGAAVLFNGIRVGEVTALALDASNPNLATATIAVAAAPPVRSIPEVGPDFQGLTGVPVALCKAGASRSVRPLPENRLH